MFHNDDTALVRVDTVQSSTHSTATAPNCVGPGRTIGILFDYLGSRLELYLNTQATQFNLGPEAVARDIRRIRRHEEISMSVRYAAPYAHLTKDQEKKVRRLCKNLLKYARSNVLSTQLNALEEIIDLAITDRVVRDALHKCNVGHLVPKFKEPILSVAISRAINCVENSEIHDLWSNFFARMDFTSLLVDLLTRPKEAEVMLKSLFDSLKKSLSNPSSSFLAARYFSCVIDQFQFRIESFNMEPSHPIEEIWEHYINLSIASPDFIEWSNVNKCGAMMRNLNDRIYRPEVISCLVKNSQDLKTFFAQALELIPIYFHPNTHNNEWSGSFSYAEAIHSSQNGDETGFDRVNSFAAPHLANFSRFGRFLEALTESKDYRTHLSFLRTRDSQTRTRLRDVFIGEEILVVFSRIARHVMEEEGMPRVSCNCLNLDKEHNSSRISIATCDYDCPMLAITILSNYCEDRRVESRALAIFLMSIIFSTNRYYKLALCRASTQPINISRNNFSLSSSFASQYGEAKLLEGVLWRFRIRGRYFFLHIGWGDLSSTHIREDLLSGDIEQIDAMLLTNDTVMLLPYTESRAPFNASGHFPIIAYKRGSEDPYYLVVADLDKSRRWGSYRTIATLKDGDSTAVFYDKRGKAHVKRNFRVLVLRHDPVDFPDKVDDPRWNKYQQGPRVGSLDATGPVYWLSYFPERHPCFSEDAEKYLPSDTKEVISTLDRKRVAATKDLSHHQHFQGGTVSYNVIDWTISIVPTENNVSSIRAGCSRYSSEPHFICRDSSALRYEGTRGDYPRRIEECDEVALCYPEGASGGKK